MIAFIDTNHLLSLQIAGISFFYSFSIFLFIFYAYSSKVFYPKPIYYCIFPITQMDFWKINIAFFWRKRLFLLLLATPIAFLFTDLSKLPYFLIVSSLSILELIFMLVIGIWLFHWLEAHKQKALFIQLPLYSAFLFYYPASKYENFWPLLFNPFGSFVFAPLLLADNALLSSVSLLIITLVISLILTFLLKKRMKWLI